MSSKCKQIAKRAERVGYAGLPDTQKVAVIGPEGYYVRLASGKANILLDEDGNILKNKYNIPQFKSDDVSVWSPFFCPEETPTNLLMHLTTEVLMNWCGHDEALLSKTLGELKEAIASLSIDPCHGEEENGESDE